MSIFSSLLNDFVSVFSAAGTALSFVWFIVFPIGFFILFKFLWMDFVHGKFYASINYVLLEIIPPNNIEKSPQLMESLYTGLAGVLKGFTVKELYCDGLQTFPFSFEIAKDGGQVRMYIRTPVQFRSMVEAHLYAQYPDVEITETEDYVKSVPPVLPSGDLNLWGADVVLAEADPLPIKTYKFFEEDVTGKMIDPLANIIEIMGKLPPDQKFWFQIIAIPIPETYRNTGRELVEELAGRAKKKAPGALLNLFSEIGDFARNIIPGMFGTPQFRVDGEEKTEEQPLEFRLTPGERKVLEALESNIGKNVFLTKLRFLLIGNKEGFSKAPVNAFVGALKQFSDINLNRFVVTSDSKTSIDYGMLMKESRLRYRQRKIFRRYVDRDPTGKMCVLSAEEMATIFHIPDMAVQSPFLSRVAAKGGSAPANLPI